MQNNSYPLIDNNLSEIKQNILATLAYFDLFNYPLTRTEIYLFLGKKYGYEFFDDGLRCLVINGIIYQFDGFYSLKNDDYLVARRVEGNERATEMIKIAKKVGAFLIRFPYVRGIAISGSLSKNFADKNADIDLFIITAKNRLWIARSIMHFFKKLSFLVNKQHYFCMNYYIDEQALEIKEKNIYTAIEIGTLIPMHGDMAFEKFYAANFWTRNFLPNKTMRLACAKPLKRSFFKSLFEWMLNNRIGNALDNRLMKVTDKRWSKKTILKKLNSHGALLSMSTGKHFAKPDPVGFQTKLLARYDNKLSALLQENEDSLIH